VRGTSFVWKEDPPSVSVKTDIPFIDGLIEASGVPASVDLDGAVTIHNGVSGDDVSPITYSRWSVSYILLGRSRRYLISDVVGFAKLRFEQAPRRIPPQHPYTKRVRARATPREKETDPAS
jgi:hypothetical protein